MDLSPLKARGSSATYFSSLAFKPRCRHVHLRSGTYPTLSLLSRFIENTVIFEKYNCKELFKFFIIFAL